MNEKPSYSHPFPLRIGDFDRFGRILPSAVLDIFQEVATVQAANMGIGRDDMLEKRVFWAVVRMKYEMVKQPEQHNVVVAKTWPHSPSRFSFLREYSLSTPEGELLARGTSDWVLVDIEKRTFASVLDYYEGPLEFLDERAFEGRLRKIKDFDTEHARHKTILPGYADIDLNGHVNNSKYPNFIYDVAPPAENQVLKTIQLDYRREVLPGDPLEVFVNDEDDFTLAKGVGKDGAIRFAAKIEYE